MLFRIETTGSPRRICVRAQAKVPRKERRLVEHEAGRATLGATAGPMLHLVTLCGVPAGDRPFNFFRHKGIAIHTHICCLIKVKGAHPNDN